MFETIQGEKIDGTVSVRRGRTMTVIDGDGHAHLCWLVGESNPVRAVSFISDKRFKKQKKERNNNNKTYPCRIIYPDGTIKDYPTLSGAAHDLDTTRTSVRGFVARGTVINRGKFRGCRFERIMEG